MSEAEKMAMRDRKAKFIERLQEDLTYEHESNAAQREAFHRVNICFATARLDLDTEVETPDQKRVFPNGCVYKRREAAT